MMWELIPYEIAICVVIPFLVIWAKGKLLKKYKRKNGCPSSEKEQSPSLNPLSENTGYNNAQYGETEKRPTLMFSAHIKRIITKLRKGNNQD